MATFDLESLAQEETAEIQMVHPGTGDDIQGFVVEVYGQDSQVFKEAGRKAEVAYTEYSRRNKGKFMPPERREELDKQKVIKCTKAIKGLAYKGKEITDPEEAYSIPGFGWILEQVTAGIVERANFLRNSATK